MKIQTITTGFDQNAGLILFGLGDDNKVYRWNALVGGWEPNWNVQQPTVAASANRNQRRAAAKKGGTKRK